MSEPFKNPEAEELSKWESLINSDDWRILLELKEKRKVYLTKECLRCVLKADFHSAVCYAAKVEDVDKEIGLIKQGLTKLRIGGADVRKNER